MNKIGKGRYTHSRRSNSKPIIVAASLILAAAALLGGAFAWTDFSQSKTNRFRGTNDADVTLHDEFDGENKDVFVENSGTNTIYVRVRLDEFMQVGDTQFDPAADIRDKTTWTPHTYTGTSIEDCAHVAPGALFHDFYKWTMSGSQRDYNPGTPGMVYSKLGTDGKVDVTGTAQTKPAAAPILMTDYLAIKAKAEAGTTLTPEEQAAWDTATGDGCWILDDTDIGNNGGGWAYWSVPLAPGEATNLLLDEVKLQKDAEDDWIYRIDVKLQAVTLGDTEKWDDPASLCGYKVTTSARELIDFWKA